VRLPAVFPPKTLIEVVSTPLPPPTINFLPATKKSQIILFVSYLTIGLLNE